MTVHDGAPHRATVISDYRWIIEEDRTFYIEPRLHDKSAASGLPELRCRIVPTFGTNFHTSYMPVVATGCTGPLSCESGQTVLGVSRGVRHRQRRLPDHRQRNRRAVDPARSIWIRPSATTSRSFRAMRPTRSRVRATGHGMGERAESPAATAWAALPITCDPGSRTFSSPVTVLTQYRSLPAVETLGVRVRGRLPAER